MALTKVKGHIVADDLALGGNPTTTTQSASDNSTKLATTAYVTTAIANLADSAPSTLNTLNELAAALGDDANFSTTVTNSIATKLPLAGGTMTGDLRIGTADAANRLLTIAGGATGNNEGGEIRLEMPADHDGTYDFWRLDVNQDDFRIGRQGLTDILVDSSGKVGIGTSAPSTLLHLNAPAYPKLTLSDETGVPRAYSVGVSNETFIIRNETGTTDILSITNGNLVGIGTTSPDSSAALTLQDADFAGLYMNLSDSSGTSIVDIRGAVSGTEKFRLGKLSSSSDDFSIRTGGTAALTIDTSQNVGIGNISATHPLHVHKNVSNDTIDETKGLVKFQSSGGNGLIFGTIASSPYSSYIQSAYVIDTSIARYNLILNPVGGNVGIGITNPSQILTLKANSPIIQFAQDGSDSYAGINFGDDDDANDGQILYDHDSRYMRFQVANAERIRINASGKVGMGTLSPNALLHVGDSNAEGSQTNPAIQIGGTSNYRLGMYTDAETAIFENKNGDDGFEFRVKTAGEVLRINGGTGQVQAYPLGVANPSYSFTNDTNTGMTRPTGDTLQFVTGGAEKMRISSGTGVSSENAVIRAADNVDIRSTHYANFEGGGYGGSTDNNVNVRKTLKEAVFGSYNVDFEPGAYSNGLYYVLAGKKASTANSYLKFKIALNKATHLKINQTVTNAADATARVTSIHYSFDDSTYTQATSAAFNAGSETTNATLDFDSIGTMSGQASSYDGTFTGNIYIRLRLYLGSSPHNTLIGWRSINFEAKAADMNLINPGGPQYGPVEAAMFRLDNASTIATNNGGFCDLRAHSSGGYANPAIFEIDTTGNYGIHIKRDGKVWVNVNQDIITTGSTSYATSRIYRSPSNDANNRVMSYQLITNTDGQWGSIHNTACFDVNAGDRIQFYLTAAGITSLDTTSWSQYNIMWMDSQHSGSANRAAATYQENAHYDFIG